MPTNETIYANRFATGFCLTNGEINGMCPKEICINISKVEIQYVHIRCNAIMYFYFRHKRGISRNKFCADFCAQDDIIFSCARYLAVIFVLTDRMRRVIFLRKLFFYLTIFRRVFPDIQNISQIFLRLVKKISRFAPLNAITVHNVFCDTRKFTSLICRGTIKCTIPIITKSHY